MDRNEILDELAWFAEPLFEAAYHEDYLVNFFKEFGHELNLTHDVNSIYAGFKSFRNSITVIINIGDTEEEDANLSPETFLEIFKSIRSLGEINEIKTYFNSDFFIEVFDFLLYRYLSTKKPFAYAIFQALGIIQRNDIDASVRGLPYTKTKFNWGRVSDFINDNPKWAKEVYAWKGNPNTGDAKSLDYELLLTTLALLLESTGFSLVMVKELTQSDIAGFITNDTSGKLYFGASLPLLQDGLENVDSSGVPVYSKEAGFKLLPYGDLNQPQNLGFALTPYTKGNITDAQQLSDNLILNIDISAQAQGGIFILITPSGISNQTGGSISAKFKLEIKYSNISDNNPISLITIAETSKLEVDAIKVAFGGDIKGDFYLAGGIEKLQATIDLGGDGFLSNFLQEPINIFVGDILAKWQFSKGVSFEGGNNLAIVAPVHLELGPLKISAIGIEIKISNETYLIFDITGSLNLGPLIASVDAIGIKAGIQRSENNGLLGKYDLDLGFKPPNGLGLSINAGAVIGGGYLFFDFEKEEYAGALELTIAGFLSVKAIGLITTKMPDGRKGFSMLIIITAEFFPPFQLGYGFTLIGVGGLLGLNRTVLLDPLREGVRTGAVNNIMFPQNVIANAPRIISDLKTIFPPIEGIFLIGPMGKLGWGTPTLISLSLGLIIEIPGNIAILGVLKIALPEECIPLVQIQVAFVGTIDFDKKMLTFDASLYESSILTMTLEGDMAVRLKWGDSPDFILTVGGFHPSYTPPPLALPTLRRLALNILNTDIARIRVECYQAVTPNSVQFGAKAEIFFDLEACSIKGHITFDALFQFSPFYFIITLSSGFKLSAVGIDVMTVRVRMSLEGPTPWRAKGKGSVSLLFFEISANFDKTWGEQKNTSLPDIEVLPLLISDLNKKEQWSTVLTSGKNLLVSPRKLEEASEDLLVMHPAGSLVVQQKLLPLSVNIDKVGNQKTSDIRQVTITSASSNGISLTLKTVNENFARAQYQNLSDAEKLSKPSFEKMPGGMEISQGDNVIKNGNMVRRKVAYELTIIDKEPKKPLPKGQFFIEAGILFANFLKGNSASKSVLSKSHAEKFKPFEQKLGVQEEGYTVANQATNKAFVDKETGKAATFASEMMAQTYMQDLLRKKPSLQKQVHIVPNYEVQRS